VFYSFVLCLLYLTFVLSTIDFRLAGISTDAGAKEFGCEEVYTAKSPLLQEPPANPKTASPRDTSVLDIAIVLGHARTINRDVVCCLLAECLQDVSSAMFAMPYLFLCCWVFNFSLFLY
jgi:hypothetical protein